MEYLLIIPTLCFFYLPIYHNRLRKKYKYSFEEVEELIHQYELKLEYLPEEEIEDFRLKESIALGCSLFKTSLWYNFKRNEKYIQNKRYNELYDECYKREKEGIYFYLYLVFCILLIFLTVIFLNYLGVFK